MSENVGAVSFGLDLDDSSLESQIASAGEKGGSMLSRILSSNSSGIWGNFAKNGLSASFKTLKGDSAGLTDQIGNQKRAVQELQSAMEKSVSETGADSRETNALREKVEAAQSSLEKMSRSLKETNSETEKSPGKFSSFANSASGAGEKSSFLSGMLGKVKNAALGMGATIGGGAGLFALAQSAVDTGNAAYELSEKLHISSAEATQFSKMLKISDTDAQPFISTMMRLDKSVETAGKKGNATTSALKEFGISLTDAHGKLLPMNDQLAALAAGYRRAEEAGNDEAFTAEILGSRGTALTNIFANYNDVLAETGKAKGIGIDPNQAHRVFLETQSLKLQLSQLGMVLSNAVIPIASSIIPPLMTQFSGLADKIKNHQSQIQSVSNTVGNLGKTVLSVVVPPIKSVFGFISSHGKASITIFMGIAGAVAAFKAAMMVSNAVTTVSNGILAIQKAASMSVTLSKLSEAAATKTVTGAQVGMNAALLACPTTWIVLGIAGLVTAFALLWQNCAGFRNFWISAWNGIQSAFWAVVNFIKSEWQALGLFLINPVAGAVKLLYDLNPQFRNWANGVGDAIKGGFNNAINFIKNLPGEALQWGKDIINGIVNGIKSAAGAVGNAVNGVAQNIRSFLHFSEPDIGPLKGFHGWWKDMMQGAGEDITGNSGYVMAALHSVTSQMRMAIQPTLLAPQLALTGSGINGGIRTQTIDKSITKAPVINVNGPVNVQSKGGQNATLQQLQFLTAL